MNGEVQCFTGTHIPLGLLAILSLVCALILIALTAGITLPWRGCMVCGIYELYTIKSLYFRFYRPGFL